MPVDANQHKGEDLDRFHMSSQGKLVEHRMLYRQCKYQHKPLEIPLDYLGFRYVHRM